MALKTLMQMLKEAPQLEGVSVLIGDEARQLQDMPLPAVIVVPSVGTWSEPGYILEADPDTETIWSTLETIDLALWAVGLRSAGAPSEDVADHYEAVEQLRTRVLQALHHQRRTLNADGTKGGGLYFKPVSGRWEQLGDAFNRYGRAYTLAVQVEISVPGAAPVPATLSTITINAPSEG